MQPEYGDDYLEQERARRRQQRAEQVQRRRLALGIVVLGLVVLTIALIIGLSGDDEPVVNTSSTTEPGVIPSGTYSAELLGENSVPPVVTQAAGTLTLTYDADEEKLSYVLKITSKLTTPIIAAIYQGGPGDEGDAVYVLYVADDGTEGTYQGTLAEDAVVEMDLVGPLEGGTLHDLIELIEDGDAYVSVGNKSHPVDAIRGQIEKGTLTGTGDETETTDEADTSETTETSEAPEDE